MSVKILGLLSIFLISGWATASRETKLDFAPAVEQGHPCYEELARYVSTKMVAIGALNGKAQVDSLAALAQALERSGVTQSEAAAIAELYRKFRNKEFHSLNLKRLATWMDRFETETVPPGIPADLRTIVCVPDLKCSLANPPLNYSFYPNPSQIILIAPAPAPGTKPQPYVHALLTGIAIAQGQSIFKRWIHSVDQLRKVRRNLEDPYAELFVRADRHSGTFEQIFSHLNGTLIRSELTVIANPPNLQQLLVREAQDTLLEIREMRLPGTEAVLGAVGIHSWRDVFSVAQKIADQIDTTIQQASAAFN